MLLSFVMDMDECMDLKQIGVRGSSINFDLKFSLLDRLSAKKWVGINLLNDVCNVITNESGLWY